MTRGLRHPEIMEIARKEGRVTVDDLASRMRVTVQTVRRDLTALTESGQLDRVHGGAILPSGVANIGYATRREMHDQSKIAIARRCAQAIPDHASLFLNIGTSTEAVARELLGHNNLLVVTNNMNVANILVANPTCQIMVSGGALRRTDGGLIGDLATSFVAQFKVDIAVIGCSALDDDGDLLDFDISEIGVSKAMLRQSRKAFLVADSSKFGRSAPARIASLRDVETFFTNAPVPKNLTDKCATWGTKIDIGS